MQVTPRPKPRAFPRTNPSFVGTQRRTVSTSQPSSSLSRPDVIARSGLGQGQPGIVYNQSFTSGSGGGASRGGEVRLMRPDHGGGRGGAGGQAIGAAHTLQSSHSYAGEIAVMKHSAALHRHHRNGRRGGDTGRHLAGRHGDEDCDSSSTSSSSSDDGSGAQRQYMIESRHSRGGVASRGVWSSKAGQGHPLDVVGVPRQSELVCRPIPTRAASVLTKQMTVDYVGGGGNRHSPVDGYSHAASSSGSGSPRPRERVPQLPVRQELDNKDRRTVRRNSEPDYVNVPPKVQETQGGLIVGGSSTLGGMIRGGGAIRNTDTMGGGEEETEERSGGTLRVRDHISPGEYRRADFDRVMGGDYANAQDLVMLPHGGASLLSGSSSFYSNTMPTGAIMGAGGIVTDVGNGEFVTSLFRENFVSSNL